MNGPDVIRWAAEKPLPGDVLARLKAIVGEGGAIVYPTNTLYGLGASIHSEKGISHLNKIKGRPSGMPLSVMATAPQIEELCIIPTTARTFIDSGDDRITAILPARGNAPPGVVHGGTLAVRLPCSELTVSLVRFVGSITATSANRHGMPTPADVQGTRLQFGNSVGAYIDSGTLSGIPTTLIDFTGKKPKIIRHGALSGEEVGKIYG